MYCSGQARGAFIRILLVTWSVCHAAVVVAGDDSDDALTLANAEALALERDAGIAGIDARREALEESAVAEAQLPDPMLQVGTMNLPTDTFSIDQEPMTQFLTLGVRQQFPPGQTRKLRRERLETLAEAKSFEEQVRARQVIRSVRGSWLNRFYFESSVEILQEQLLWFEQLEATVTAAYAAGTRQQHDVIRVQLEIEFLKEREIELRQESLAWRGELGRWLGADAARPLPSELPEMPALGGYAEAIASLGAHPQLGADASRIRAGKISETIADQQYKPAWSLDLRYGFRDGEDPMGERRPNFFSAMVNFSLPVFTGNRQDRRSAAAAAETRGLINSKADDERQLRGRFDMAWARWAKRVSLSQQYERDILPAAQANVDAVLDAYQNDRAIFDELVRAEKTLLDSELKALRLEIDARTAQADLLYLTGE